MIWCWDGYNIQNYRYLEPGNYTCLRCGDSIPNETVQKSCIYTNKPVAIVTDNWVLNHIMYPIGEIFTLNLLKINTTINATSPFKPFEKIKQGVPYEK